MAREQKFKIGENNLLSRLSKVKKVLLSSGISFFFFFKGGEYFYDSKSLLQLCDQVCVNSTRVKVPASASPAYANSFAQRILKL